MIDLYRLKLLLLLFTLLDLYILTFGLYIAERVDTFQYAIHVTM